jgi:MFS family permease
MILLSAWLMTAAVILALIPEVIAKDALHPYAIYFLHAGRILNSLACPPIAVTVTKLSAVWFGDKERTLVTAVAVVMNNAGSAFGMIISPYAVPYASDMPRLLWIQAGLAIFALICCLIYMPIMPPTHPSPAAKIMFSRPAEKFLPAARIALRSKDFILLIVCAGLSQGILNSWSGVLSTILPSSYSSTTVGWLMFAANIAGICGGLSMAYIAQQAYFRTKLKLLIVTFLGSSVIFAIAFMLCLPSIFDLNHALIPASTPTLGLLITLLGFSIGSAYPIAFELAVELTYPINESVSGGLLTAFMNGSGVALLFVAPSLSGATMNIILVCVLLLCAILSPMVHEKYLRQEAEADSIHGMPNYGNALSPLNSNNDMRITNQLRGRTSVEQSDDYVHCDSATMQAVTYPKLVL